jgi:hypothetical protein
VIKRFGVTANGGGFGFGGLDPLVREKLFDQVASQGNTCAL